MSENSFFDPVDDPKNWTWGMFYYNKDDIRLFPPKRIRLMGWTVNFANPWSILSMLGIIALLGSVSYLSNKVFK